MTTKLSTKIIDVKKLSDADFESLVDTVYGLLSKDKGVKFPISSLL